MHTAVHLVSNCLSGPLSQDRTIILVTHHISLCLPIASYLVELAQGKIIHRGTIQELRERGQLDEVLEAEDETPETPGDEPVVDAAGLQNEADNIKRGPVNRVERQDAKKLIEAEARAEGRVSWLTYVTYVRAAGIFSWVLTVCLMLLIRAINIGNQASNLIETQLQFLNYSNPNRFSWRNGEQRTMTIKPIFLQFLR